MKLDDPSGSEPGFTRPVLVAQSNNFNLSKINTVIVVALTSNMKLADAPGNVTLKKAKSRLKNNSVTNVSQIIAIDKALLTELIGNVDKLFMKQIDEGLRLVLSI